MVDHERRLLRKYHEQVHPGRSWCAEWEAFAGSGRRGCGRLRLSVDELSLQHEHYVDGQQWHPRMVCGDIDLLMPFCARVDLSELECWSKRGMIAPVGHASRSPHNEGAKNRTPNEEEEHWLLEGAFEQRANHIAWCATISTLNISTATDILKLRVVATRCMDGRSLRRRPGRIVRVRSTFNLGTAMKYPPPINIDTWTTLRPP